MRRLKPAMVKAKRFYITFPNAPSAGKACIGPTSTIDARINRFNDHLKSPQLQQRDCSQQQPENNDRLQHLEKFLWLLYSMDTESPRVKQRDVPQRNNIARENTTMFRFISCPNF